MMKEKQERKTAMLFEKQMVKFFRGQLCTRQDNPHGIFYFSAGDFPGMQSHSYSFRSSMGHTLEGCFYHYEEPVPGRLVVFDHGMGNGHRAYLREIERLCRGGFLVFTYDHTGCMASGGDHIGGFAQSLHDLDDCMKALKAEKALAGYDFSVVGHSWGGFSTMNIAAFHPEISHVVSMSGFVSVERMLRQLLGDGLMGGYARCLLEAEKAANPAYAEISAVKTLKNTTAKVLLIYSTDDKTVHKAAHYDVLRGALAGKENVCFLLVEGKDHNPSYTADAVAYKNGFFAEYQKAVKKKRLNTPEAQREFMSRYDWKRMTQQDETVWQAVLEALK